jgi:hypothetical protein
MALSNKARNTIEAAIKRFIAYLRYMSIGPHALSRAELQDLARNGMISRPTKTAVSEAYIRTHAKALVGTTAGPAPKAIRDGAIKFLERMFQAYSEKAGESLKTDMMATIESHLMPIFDRREGQQIYEVLKDKNKYSKNLAATLRGKVDNWEHRWRTIVTTELNRASNWGSMDAIITANPNRQPDEIYVYKSGPSDEATCKHCLKFWFLADGITPKVYKMSDLMNNGSNIGRKAKDWLPTIDSTHPNERHILHEITPGWGFNGSNLTYKGKDHSEYHYQTGLRKAILELPEPLVKANRPPTHIKDSLGDYVATRHLGELAWRNNEAVSKEHDKAIAQGKEFFTSIQKPEHQQLVNSFFNAIEQHPNKHLIPTKEGKTGKTHFPRARHLAALFQNKNTVHMKVQNHNGQDYVIFKAIRHGNEEDVHVPEDHRVVYTWAYHPTIGMRLYSKESIHKDKL